MDHSRRTTLSPVIIGAIFMLMLSACEHNTMTIDEASNTPTNEDSAPMELINRDDASNTPLKENSASMKLINNGDDAETRSDNEGEDDMQSSAAAVLSAPTLPASSKKTVPASEAAAIPKQKYADGTFAADGNYRSPAGAEDVHISLILKGDVITNATYVGTATHEKSIKYQALFGEGFKQAVVGKPIDSLNLDVVNGSSLTPAGFMDALQKIKAEAKA